MSEPLDQRLARWRADIDAELVQVSTRMAGAPDQLRQAVHYSLTGEGKRLRGLLLIAAHDALGASGPIAALAAGVEVVHAYSLVHDDLPCMDNDNMRRGRPTVHRRFDVATATVAGVVMVPLAVKQVLHAAQGLGLEAAATGDLVATLMRASGGAGMVGGQLLDLRGEGAALSLEQLEEVHRAKTGALIAASLRMGAIAARGSRESADALTHVGDALGLAFQIADDVLDATESSESLGKTAGADAALAKSTYASLLGVHAARDRSNVLVAEAMDTLGRAGLRTPALERLAHFVSSRRS